jgi:two-component system, NtrC family, response regulator AtoC
MDVLVVDDDPLVSQTLSQQLTALGFHVDTAMNGKAAEQLWQSKDYGLALLDLALPDTTGLDLLRRWRQAVGAGEDGGVPAIMISGTGTIAQAVEAMKLGAMDFLVKPVDMTMLEAVVERSVRQTAMRKENRRLRGLTQAEAPRFLGASGAVTALLNEAAKISRGDLPLLLEGETGTGKQVLAQWMHAQSERAQEPFVRVNCAAITETLFESELFGHEKGAFTGAIARKPGKLELVGQGTLFLDEIGELPPACQAKLLVAVEDRTFERVGGVQTLRFEGRVLAATNRELDKEVAAGRFRKDMFFRLNAFRLKLPPLRERPEDVEVYIEATLARLRRELGRKLESPEADVLSHLRQYPWPGNVRELIHHVERVALFSESARIPRALWLSFPTDAATTDSETDPDPDLRAALDAFKRRHILRIVASCGGNQTEAAKQLGIERTHLNRLLADYQGRG